MPRNLNDSKAPSKPNDMKAPDLKPGGYPGRLVGITFLGVQKQRPYKGEAKPPHEMVRYTYELSHEFMHDLEGKVLEDKPRWFSEDFKVYPPDAEKATMTQRNQAIDPEDESEGDPTKLLGLPCTVVLVKKPGRGKHAGKEFTNVGDVTPAPNMPGYTQPELVNPTHYFDPQDEDCTLDDFRKLPEFIQKQITGADDFNSSALKKLMANEPKGEEENDNQPDGGQPEPAKGDDAGDPDDPY